MFFNSFDKFLMTFDSHGNFNVLDVNNRAFSFPPTDIYYKEDDRYRVFTIEMAIAGFSSSDISVELTPNTDSRVTHNKLRISGKVEGKSLDPSDHGTSIVSRIARRPFHQTFAVDKGFEVHDVKIKNGILNIILREEKPRPVESQKYVIREE